LADEKCTNISGEKQIRSLTGIFPLALPAGLIFSADKALDR